MPMTPELFVGALGLTLGALLIWGFYTLTNERWQIIAAVPVMKDSDGNWRGLNLTYYGFFTATACALGAVMFTFLSGDADVWNNDAANRRRDFLDLPARVRRSRQVG